MTDGQPLSHDAERRLYDRDHAAWLVYKAPRLAECLAAAADARVGLMWSLLTREAQVVVWDILDSAQRDRIRAARADDDQVMPA